MGVYAQICYQNSGVTQAGSLMALGDAELALTIIKLYNDASAERQKESGQRLFTLGHLPLWDKAAMEAEARRCLDMGIKGFVLPDTPERLKIVHPTSTTTGPRCWRCARTAACRSTST